ncbi:hypothetical protein AMECASPLE_032259 [Ameca splendens]|uniref:Uncharacterized protein n=1 Tax=Ameca splendens TaxID=208324 RepID=A0ABV0XVH3_9TELE
MCLIRRACTRVCSLENKSAIPRRVKLFMRLRRHKNNNNKQKTGNIPRCARKTREKQWKEVDLSVCVCVGGWGGCHFFIMKRVKAHAHGGQQRELHPALI